MSMVFHSSSTVCVLLSGWYVSSALQWLVLALFVAALAGLREFMLVYRQHRARQRRLHQIELREAATHDTAKPAPTAPSSSDPVSLSWPSSPVRSSRRTADESNSHHFALLDSGDDTSSALSTSLARQPPALSWADVSNASVNSAIYLLSVLLAYVLMLLVMTYNVPLCALVVLLSAVAHLLVNLSFTAWWRRDAQLRLARRMNHARDGEADVNVGAQSQRRQQRGGYVEVGAPPVMVEEVRAASDPCCGNVDEAYD